MLNISTTSLQVQTTMFNPGSVEIKSNKIRKQSCFDVMNHLQLFVLFLFIFPSEAQDTSTTSNGPQRVSQSVAILISVLVVLFLVLATLSVYIYSKYFYRHIPDLSNHRNNFNQLLRFTSRSSGIDRSVIESIPFFKFSSLKGSKEGLECSICLSTYEDSEVLRLLPKCKHAFHMTCIDEWLESHSSCPICRYNFDSTEFTSFHCTSSLRYNGNTRALNLIDGPNLELFVEREEDRHESTRFNIGNSFRKLTKSRNEDCLALESDLEKKFHKLKHKIIVSDIFHKRRWSDLNSSDLTILNSEMLNIMSSKRFNSNSLKHNLTMNEPPSNTEDCLERKPVFKSEIVKTNHTTSISGSSSFPPALMNEGSKDIDPGLFRSTEKRSMSEIILLGRFKDFRARSYRMEMPSLENNSRDERIWRLWLPIARRTFQWFTVRENRFEGSRMRTHTSNV